MKKVKILGKVIPVFVLVLLGIGMVSGALVGYLSNQAEVSVTVESPVKLEVSASGVGGSWVEAITGTVDLPLGSVYGGEEITFWIRDTNLADVAIVGSSTKLVTCNTGLNCSDFASVKANGNDLLTLPNGCVVVDWKTVDFSAYTSGGLAANGETGYSATNKIEVEFKPGAKGTYVFTMQKMAE